MAQDVYDDFLNSWRHIPGGWGSPQATWRGAWASSYQYIPLQKKAPMKNLKDEVSVACDEIQEEDGRLHKLADLVRMLAHEIEIRDKYHELKRICLLLAMRLNTLQNYGNGGDSVSAGLRAIAESIAYEISDGGQSAQSLVNGEILQAQHYVRIYRDPPWGSSSAASNTFSPPWRVESNIKTAPAE